ncbi:sigma factor-like helix-turn-helix DNA-binding protein [Streptomyces sp. A5-4]|uniref:sigma factor-like helix-turn-helix DNA-binding protein n=1 Tax=Streptomyces sp. A5-4 TaxID=3384771 RepID=UPI003DA91506
MTQSTSTVSASSLPSPKERRRLREAKSLSHEQIATAIGVTRETVRSWETGRTSPKGRKRQAYLRMLVAAEAKKPREPERMPGLAPDPVVAPEPASTSAPASAPESEAEPERAAAPDPGPETDAAAASGAEPAPAVVPVAGPVEPPVPDLTPAEAFDALYTRSAPAILRQAYLLTGRQRLSRESVRHAFHLAWQRWPEVATDRDPAGWVRAAAYEYAMSPWHRLRCGHKYPDRVPAAPDRRELLDALLDLPPAYRRTLLLYDGLGLDLPETAAETEASTPATANRLVNARAAVVERLPELARASTPAEQSALLHERLGTLSDLQPAATLPPGRAVRTGSERRTRFCTRAAIALTTLIIGATAFTLVTAPTRYEPPRAPGETVDGVPVRGGPLKLSEEDIELRDRLRAEPMNGPERLVPLAR